MLANKWLSVVGDEASRQLGVSHLYTSCQGVSVVCAAVQQLVHSRLGMSRDLLFALTLMVQMGEQVRGHMLSAVGVLGIF